MVFNLCYGGKIDLELERRLKITYGVNRSEFDLIYRLASFAESVRNPKIVHDIALAHLDIETKKKIDLAKTDPIVLLLPLIKKDANLLKRIYYELLLQSSNLKHYETSVNITKPVFQGLTFEVLSAAITKFGSRTKASAKRLPILWWFETNKQRTVIVYRRERKARSSVKLASKNEFVKTADVKIAVFVDNGNTLQFHSKSEKKGSLEIMELVVSQLAKTDVKYEETLITAEPQKLSKFLFTLINTGLSGLQLNGIGVRNVPITDSPVMYISTSTGKPINLSIEDLRKRHNLDILKDPNNIQRLTLLIDGKNYMLGLSHRDDGITVSYDSKNCSDENREKLVKLLCTHLS